ncbi:MAG: dUTP diphosphatase, partial [Patescibacteria group bacterium]
TIENIHEELWAKISELLNGKQSTEDTLSNNTKQNNNHNYAGFKAVGDIINNNQAKSFPTASPEKTIEIKVNEIKPTGDKINNILSVERLNNDVKLPTKAHQGDAGYDLYSRDYYSIAPYGQVTVGTGIKMVIPTGYVGLIWDKSGIASNGIKTMGGVIDENYRGEIKVVVKNLSEIDFNIIPGQKIAQILIQKVDNFEISEEKINDQTDRQENGFGSSGKF